MVQLSSNVLAGSENSFSFYSNEKYLENFLKTPAGRELTTAIPRAFVVRRFV